MKCGTVKIARHNAVLMSLRRHATLKSKGLSEADWIASAFNCNTTASKKMIEEARAYDAARQAAEKEGENDAPA